MRRGLLHKQYQALLRTLILLSMFVGLATMVAYGVTDPIDVNIRKYVHNFTSPTLTTFLHDITRLGSVTFLAVFSGVFIIGFYLMGWRRPAIRLACVMVGAIILENGLKYAFHRVRPDPFFDTSPVTYSFPSGHALFSFCFYFAVASIFSSRVHSGIVRILIYAATTLLVLAIGFSRIYLGVHYPTDVTAGYLVAAFWLSAVMNYKPNQQ
jgi:undecaprenyl-diphosphatase